MSEPSEAPTEPAASPGLDWRAATMPGLAVLGAGLVVASAVLPWYARQIGPVGADPSISGLEAGSLAVAAIALGALALILSALLALDAIGVIAVDPPIALLLSWAAIGAGTAAAALVAYRLVFIPEPQNFFTRDVGIWLAFFGALICAGLIAFQTPERAREAGRRAAPIPRSGPRRAARRRPG